MASPTLQKNLPISFVLDDGAGLITELALPIRPEDLTRTEPSRVTAVNTLDGAFLDSFGRGLSSIQINGHTGWGAANRPDGMKKFAELRDEYIHKWHRLRERNIAGGRSPDDIRLIFSDTLNNNFVGTVAPLSFSLKRTKSGPLLMYYSISMIVLDDQASKPFNQTDFEDFRRSELSYGSMSPAGLTSMASSLGSMQSLSFDMGSGLGAIGAFGSQVKAVTDQVMLPIMSVATSAMGVANQINGTVNAAASVALGVASQAAKAGEAIWGAVAAAESIPLNLMIQSQQIKSEFTNVFCLLKNALTGGLSAWDYSDFYGASNCSSTAGGGPLSPLRGVNGFELFNQTQPQAFSFNQPAIDSLRFLSGIDQVNPPSISRMGAAAESMISGVTFFA